MCGISTWRAPSFPFQHVQGLLAEALVVEHAGVVELLVQLNIRVLAGVVHPQAGQQLPGEVGQLGASGWAPGRARQRRRRYPAR